MSLALLDSLQSESTRLALAGSRFAREDFRLKKLVEPLQELGAKSPVFAKLAESTNALLEASEDDSSAKLLALLTMVRAVRSAQASAGVEGDLVPIVEQQGTRETTPMSARRLLSIVDCLVNSGDGRLSRLEGEIERGIEPDARIFHHVCKAVETGHAQLSDMLMQKMLPSMGKEAFDVFAASYSMDGKSTDIRRLRAMAATSWPDTLPYLLLAARKAKTDMRAAALSLLGHPDAGSDVIALLKEAAEDKSEKIAAAARVGLAGTGDRGIFGFLRGLFQSKPEGKGRVSLETLIGLPPGEASVMFVLEELPPKEEWGMAIYRDIGPLIERLVKGCPTLPDMGPLFGRTSEDRIKWIYSEWHKQFPWSDGTLAVPWSAYTAASLESLISMTRKHFEQRSEEGSQSHILELLGYVIAAAKAEKAQNAEGKALAFLREIWTMMPELVRQDWKRWRHRMSDIGDVVSDSARGRAEVIVEFLKLPPTENELVYILDVESLLKQLLAKQAPEDIFEVLSSAALQIAKTDPEHLGLRTLMERIRSSGYTDPNFDGAAAVKQKEEVFQALLASRQGEKKYIIGPTIMAALVDARWISLLPQLGDKREPAWNGVPLFDDSLHRQILKELSQNQSHE